MPLPTDQEKNDLAYDSKDLAGEINKIYQRMNLAGKNAAVDRFRRKVNQLAQLIEESTQSSSSSGVLKRLEDASQIVHECAPLMDLNLKKLLLSEDLQKRWTQRLESLDQRLHKWTEGA